MNKGSILKRFLYLFTSFPNLLIIESRSNHLSRCQRYKAGLSLNCCLASHERRSSFLGKTSWVFFEGFKALSSLKAWGMIGLTYLGIYIVTRIGAMVMMMEGVSNSTNQATIENAHMNPFLLITLTVIMAPIVEELVFRGILMGRVFNPDSIVGLIVE